MRFTDAMKALWLGVTGDIIANGTIVVYGGTPPTLPGDTSQSAYELVELRIAAWSGVSDDGAMEAKSVRSGVGKVTGTPTWFQVRAPNGSVVGDGLVGKEPGQLQVDPPTIMQGGRVDGVRFVLGW
jgi:hypothetical protein